LAKEIILVKTNYIAGVHTIVLVICYFVTKHSVDFTLKDIGLILFLIGIAICASIAGMGKND
jgi:hypothetical protein